MSVNAFDADVLDDETGTGEVIAEVRREAALLKTGALQNAILNSANFSSIATDEKGVIQLFNVGAERMRKPEAPGFLRAASANCRPRRVCSGCASAEDTVLG